MCFKYNKPTQNKLASSFVLQFLRNPQMSMNWSENIWS